MADFPKAKKLTGKAGWCIVLQILAGVALGILSLPGITEAVTEHPAAVVYFVTVGLYFAFIYYMVYAAEATGRNKILWGFLASGFSLIAFFILHSRITKERAARRVGESSAAASGEEQPGVGGAQGNGDPS